MQNKITQKEWRHVDSQLHAHGFTSQERNTLRAVFEPHLGDVDAEETRPLFSPQVPGVTEKELNETMPQLRDPNSSISKALKVPLHRDPKKLDKAEEILRDTLNGNKESWF